MKAKQFEYISSTANRYLTELRHGSQRNAPIMEEHIVREIVSGRPVKLRPLCDVVQSARERIVGTSSYRDLKFTKIFATPKSYIEAQARYQEEARVAEERAKQFEQASEAILRKCQLEDDYPAEDAAVALLTAARRAGYKG